MIQFKRATETPADYQRGTLPPQAVKMKTPASFKDVMRNAAPVMGIFSALMFAAMFLKALMLRTMPIHPLAVPAGVAIGLLLLPVHEWLHAIVYPSAAKVTICRLKGSINFVVLASYPMKRHRFLLMCLLPFLLGMIPLAVFLLLPAEYPVSAGIAFGAACIGMASPSPDVCNVYFVLRQSRKNEQILFYEDDMYRIPVQSEHGETV